MRRASTLVATAALFAILFAGTTAAQSQDNPERKIISRIPPIYPEIARRMRLGGIVKLEVVVRANGTVKSSKVLGGSPALIEPAIYAIQKWKFETASGETVEIVQISFELT
jgi:TonB family protein